MTEANQGSGTAGTPLWRRRWFWTTGAMLAGFGALAAVAPRAWAFRGMSGRGFAGHFGHGPARHGLGAQLLRDPAAAKEHVALATEFVLRGVNATDEQQEKARQVTDRLVDQLGPLAERHHALHAALVQELAKPQIDRAAVEKLRQQGMALADEASKVALAGVEDVGDVLTPEQRAELVAFARRFHGGAPLD
jgi:Spy/CpxP family protein refolding chaperone